MSNSVVYDYHDLAPLDAAQTAPVEATEKIPARMGATPKEIRSHLEVADVDVRRSNRRIDAALGLYGIVPAKNGIVPAKTGA